MADINSFPVMRNILISGSNIQSFIAGADIKAGQIVAFHGTGVSWTVHPCISGTTYTIVGVALFDTVSGNDVAVACRGCQAYIQNGTDGAIDTGDPIKAYGATTPGTGTPVDMATGTVVPKPVVGYALVDLAAAGALAIDIDPCYITKS